MITNNSKQVTKKFKNFLSFDKKKTLKKSDSLNAIVQNKFHMSNALCMFTLASVELIFRFLAYPLFVAYVSPYLP